MFQRGEITTTIRQKDILQLKQEVLETIGEQMEKHIKQRQMHDFVMLIDANQNGCKMNRLT